MTYEYETPGKLLDYEPDLDEKTLSRFVYSGRVRLQKSPGVPLSVQELNKRVGHTTRAPARISAVDGN
jgi:hypothetical protein